VINGVRVTSSTGYSDNSVQKSCNNHVCTPKLCMYATENSSSPFLLFYVCSPMHSHGLYGVIYCFLCTNTYESLSHFSKFENIVGCCPPPPPPKCQSFIETTSIYNLSKLLGDNFPLPQCLWTYKNIPDCISSNIQAKVNRP